MNKMTWTILAALIITTIACTRNAITGRQQLSLISEQEVQLAARTQYKQFLSQSDVVTTKESKDAEMVKRVGNRIAKAITTYYSKKGITNELSGYKWEFNLIQNKEVNAWCMPGGKVVVYSGLLPIAQNEAGLAVVMGHEIMHAVGGHGRERMSQGMAAQGLEVLGNVALGRNPQALGIFNAVYAPSATIGVLLPNSRKQETEADRYGLIFAAMAGYNPEEAIPFWQRMSSVGGEKPPVFLSSHPTDEQRIQNLKEFMPEALSYYTPISK